jgi:hypothetical protein
MASTVKQYFLVPNFDFNPNGALRLGRVYAEPRLLSSLNPEAVVAIPEDAIFKPEPQNNWKDTLDRRNAGVYGVWASFLQGLGIDANLSVSFDGNEETTFKVDQLRTEYFDPTLAYLEESINAPSVDQYIKEHKFKKPVYMVTGVKIARGGSVKEKHSNKLGRKAKIGFGPPGLPSTNPNDIEIISTCHTFIAIVTA